MFIKKRSDENSEKIFARHHRRGAVCDYLVCIFLPRRHRGEDSLPPRLVGRKGTGTRTDRILRADGRALAMDKLGVQRHADIPDCTVVQQHRRTESGHQRLPPVAARERMANICLPVGILYPAACLRLPSVDGGIGSRDMGVQQLFPHHHRRRSPVEGDGAGLSAANDCGHRARLSRQVALGIHRYGDIHGIRGEG